MPIPGGEITSTESWGTAPVDPAVEAVEEAVEEVLPEATEEE